MKSYSKLFLVFLVLLIASMSVSVAADSNITSHKVVKKDVKVSDNNHIKQNSITKNVNVSKDIRKVDNKVKKTTSKENISKVKRNVTSTKTSDANNLMAVNVTDDNFNEYFTVHGTSVMMNKNYFSSDMNDTSLNLQFLPDDVDTLDLSLNRYWLIHHSLVIDAKDLPLTNVGLDVSTSFGNVTLNNFNITNGYLRVDTNNNVTMKNFNITNGYLRVDTNNNVIMKNLNIVYNEDYNQTEFVTVSGSDSGTKYLYNVTINMKKNNVSKGNVLDIRANNTHVENCVVNARLVETYINWNDRSIPDAIGVSITGHYCVFSNNTFNITSSGIAVDNLVSLYAVYDKAVGLKFLDNVVYLTNVTGYAYALDNRGSSVLVARNKFFVESVTYANAITSEMSMMGSSVFRDNYVNVSAGWDLSPWGNICVAYGIQVLEMSYGGTVYTSSGYHPRYNNFINNTVVGSAGQIYGFEIWGSVDTNLTGNHINITGRTPMGMGIIGALITVSDNDIVVNGEHNHTESTVDYITSRATGIWVGLSCENIVLNNNSILADNCMGIYLFRDLSNLTAENNTIVSYGHDYAIDLTEASSKNTIRYNRLFARNHEADDAVITNTSQTNTIEDNTGYHLSKIELFSSDSVNYNQTLPILILVKDKETGSLMGNQQIIITIDDEEVVANVDDSGMLVYNYTSTLPGNKLFKVRRDTSPIYNEKASTTITVGEDKDLKIQELTNTITEQEETIQEQKQQINNKNTTVTQKQTEITQKQQETQALNNTVNQLQKELKDTTNQIKKQNNTNNNQNGTTKTKSDLTITITPNKKTLKAGQQVTLNIKMTDKKTNKAVTSAALNIKIGSKTVKATLKNGVAKVTYTVPRGCDAQTIKVSTSYSSDKYNKQTANTLFKVTKTTPTLKKTSITYKNKKTTIKATIKDATKKLLNKNVKVTVKIDGKAILKNKVIKNGKISLSFKKALKKGNHKIVITSASTKAFNKATLKTSFKV